MRLRKEICRPGTYYHPNPTTGLPEKFVASKERIQHWHDEGKAMLADGLSIPVPIEHNLPHPPVAQTPAQKAANDLKNNAGWVTDFELEPDGKLYSVLEIHDKDIIEKIPAGTVKWTSPYFASFLDGTGKTRTDVVAHVALTSRPRMTNQQPFQTADAAFSYFANLSESKQDAGFELSRAGLLTEQSGKFAAVYPVAFSLYTGVPMGEGAALNSPMTHADACGHFSKIGLECGHIADGNHPMHGQAIHVHGSKDHIHSKLHEAGYKTLHSTKAHSHLHHDGTGHHVRLMHEQGEGHDHTYALSDHHGHGYFAFGDDEKPKKKAEGDEKPDKPPEKAEGKKEGDLAGRDGEEGGKRGEGDEAEIVSEIEGLIDRDGDISVFEVIGDLLAAEGWDMPDELTQENFLEEMYHACMSRMKEKKNPDEITPEEPTAKNNRTKDGMQSPVMQESPPMYMSMTSDQIAAIPDPAQKAIAEAFMSLRSESEGLKKNAFELAKRRRQARIDRLIRIFRNDAITKELTETQTGAAFSLDQGTGEVRDSMETALSILEKAASSIKDLPTLLTTDVTFSEVPHPKEPQGGMSQSRANELANELMGSRKHSAA